MKIKKLLDRFSLLPQGLRYKLLIAFSLMSVIPLLVIGYMANNFVLLEQKLSLGQISIIILFCIIIAWLGLFLAKSIIERVIDIALETRIIADGNFEKKIFVDTEDEIGQIGEAINFLTRKIRTNMSDLRDYQDKMKEINMDIQRRVSVLTNLLQIGEMISSAVKLDSILELVLSKLSQLYDGGFAGLYFSESGKNIFTLRASSNIDKNSPLSAAIEEGRELLGKAILKRKHAVVDSSSKFSSAEQEFKAKYKCENIVAYPMSIATGVRALLVVGNNARNFTYTNDDIEIIKIFTGQISIAVENDMLIKKAEKLEIKDELTGLFNKEYILNRLKEEIERSFVSQRPCSFVMVDVDNFKKYEEEKGEAQAEIALKKIAHIFYELALPLSKAGRIDGNTFGLILPESNKKDALGISERMRKAVEKLELSRGKDDRITVSAGVSENPLDGRTADEIFGRAKDALGEAKRKGKNRTEGLGV